MRSSEIYPGERRHQYAFASFTLDPERRVLRRGRQEVGLRAKSFDVLTYLVDRHGEVVTKAQLMEAVWADTAVTDNSLAQCMVEIRRALDDDSQKLIRTVARRGYVFAASVTTPVVEFSPPPAVAPAEPRLVAPTLSPRALNVRRRYVAGAVALVLATLAVSGLILFRQTPFAQRERAYTQLTNFTDSAVTPALSPDGRMLAFFRAKPHTSASAHPEALLAWKEGNDLMALDPHSAASDRGTPMTLERAIHQYELAVEKDPLFARAWASLAEAYDYALPYVGRDWTEDARRAEAAARRAVQLDDNLAAGHAMLALVLFGMRWDFAGAEKEYRHAIELDPRGAWAIVEYADLLRETGRTEQAAAEIRKVRALLPMVPVLAVKEAEIQVDQKQPDAAIQTADSALRMNRYAPRAHVALGMAWESKGNIEQALRAYGAALTLSPNDRRALPALGYLLGKLGRRTQALSIARQLEDLTVRVRNMAYQVAVVYAGLGDSERALDWLERAYQTRQVHLPFMAVDYRLRSLRNFSRFHAILDRLGLKPV